LKPHTVGVNAVFDVDAFVALEHDGPVEGPFLTRVAVAVVAILRANLGQGEREKTRNTENRPGFGRGHRRRWMSL
jgi:hypothetical protein